VIDALKAAGAANVSANVTMKIVAHTVQRGLKVLPNVKNIIAVASGKGGVGKSTVAANLALALAAEGARVGMLDADIYGPSQPTMLGISGKPESVDGKTLEPMENHGLQASSIGFLIDADQPMVWRGPMVTQALQQLLAQTNWKDLDYLVVDMPPGTGDIQLTLAQQVPVTGAVIVTTPQDIALIDARKGLKMFEKVGIPILGIVENMACTSARSAATPSTSSAPAAAEDGGALRRRAPRQPAARHPHPRAGRRGPADRGRGARQRDRRDLQGHRAQGGGADRREGEGHVAEDDR
jgi:ATP-binding protein involved in chromosome partitioning